METYLRHLERESRFQAQRIKDFDIALAAAKKAYKSEFSAKKKQIKQQHLSKTGKQRKKMYDEAMPGIMHKHYDPEIIKYEKAAYYGTVSLGALLSDIGQGLRAQRMVMGSEVESEMTTVRVGDHMGLGSVHVVTYYKLDGRFRRVAQGTSGLPGVFKHRSRDVHFVQDRYGVFIPRYVVRNLAKRDLPHLGKPVDRNPNLGMASRNGMVLPNQDFDTAVLNHLRAAEQGSSFFVSTTHLDRPIFGATGKGFYNNKSGQVVIDLSQIPQDRIVDVSSKRARERFMKTGKLDWSLKFKEDDIAYQRMAAARDTVRTGEVLVHGRIPRTSIVTLRSKATDGNWIIPNYVKTTVPHAKYPTPTYK